MLRIHSAGLRATVQDRGRYEHLRSGVPPAGPADPLAFRAALALVGAPADAACIEVVGLPFTFSCDDARLVAVTGRDAGARSRSRLTGWTATFVRAGEEVTLTGSERTRYAYLAVSGGVDVPAVLGSRATYLPAAMGPIGRALRAGDALPLGAVRVDVSRAGRQVTAPDYGARVRAMRGPHDRLFGEAAVASFFREPFTVAADSDRMGVRIGGATIAAADAEVLSCGVVAGAVQVPRSGAPIVLLADHQTTGGYAVIATVIGADLGLVAQRAAGETVMFREVSVGDAVPARAIA